MSRCANRVENDCGQAQTRNLQVPSVRRGRHAELRAGPRQSRRHMPEASTRCIRDRSRGRVSRAEARAGGRGLPDSDPHKARAVPHRANRRHAQPFADSAAGPRTGRRSGVNPPLPATSSDASAEISALIEVLHATDLRLEELLGGEVDAVMHRDGEAILLRRAQSHLRESENARQAAVLNALPAQIALLDTRGVIVSVNDAWRQFADANAFRAAGHGIGFNYLDVCDRARGHDASVATEVCTGIHSVLSGGANAFSMEYRGDSPTRKRWFLLTVTPLPGDPPKGAVVMHL